MLSYGVLDKRISELLAQLVQQEEENLKILKRAADLEINVKDEQQQ